MSDKQSDKSLDFFDKIRVSYRIFNVIGSNRISLTISQNNLGC